MNSNEKRSYFIPSMFLFPYSNALFQIPRCDTELKAKSSVRTLHTFRGGKRFPCFSRIAKHVSNAETKRKQSLKPQSLLIIVIFSFISDINYT